MTDDPREQLRVIRSLMERATIYRALSAPTALVGGLLSLAAWVVTWEAAVSFLPLWLGVLLLTGVCNAFFLWRGAARRGDEFFSPGMKTALVSLAPAILAAGVFTLVDQRPLDLAVMWVVFYGVGLLGTQHFAPRSLAALGWVFLASGCVLLVAWRHMLFVPVRYGLTDPAQMGDLPSIMDGPPQQGVMIASGVMAGTFGGIHLLYAVAVWIRGEERSKNAAAHV